MRSVHCSGPSAAQLAGTVGLAVYKLYLGCCRLAVQGEEHAQEYWRKHVDAEAAAGSEAKGVHALFLQRHVQRHGKASPGPVLACAASCQTRMMRCVRGCAIQRCEDVAPPPPTLQDGFAVGGRLSIADLLLFDIISLHLNKFGDALKEASVGRQCPGTSFCLPPCPSHSACPLPNTQAYPALVAHHDKIAALPAVAAYLASPLRPPK